MSAKKQKFFALDNYQVIFSESCTNCKKERCMKEGKPGKGKGGKHAARKTAGGAPRQKPLAILDKVTLIPIIVS